MSYRWRYEDEAGTEVDGPAEQFDDQQQAEDWLGAEFEELRADGIGRVTLLDGHGEVYSMSLDPA